MQVNNLTLHHVRICITSSNCLPESLQCSRQKEKTNIHPSTIAVHHCMTATQSCIMQKTVGCIDYSQT